MCAYEMDKWKKERIYEKVRKAQNKNLNVCKQKRFVAFMIHIGEHEYAASHG